jgi:hypothetical protein
MGSPLTFTGPGIPIGAAPGESEASALQSSVAYGATQDPDQYANQLKLQKQTGVPPAISGGNMAQVKQAADVNAIDYPKFVAANPRTTAWASNPENAAVSGVSEVQRLGGIENNAAQMRAATPWENFSAGLDQFNRAANQKVMEYPLTRSLVDVAAGTAGMAGNIGSFLGWHGDGPSKQNLLQRIETSLSPEANLDPASEAAKSNGLDWLMKNVAPMVPAVLATGGTSLLARTLGLGPTAAKVLSGLTVGGLFDADQAGKTYTALSASGANDYTARLAANRAAAINALPNALFGATDVVPFMRDNPLLTSLGLGGATGATGQIGQNIATKQPWSTGVAGAAVQGAAAMGGMHIGMGGFGENMSGAVDATEQSKLRQRSPEKFDDAMQTIFAGDQSLRIPVDQFNSYFQGKGVDPQAVATGLGSTNYAEAHLSGGDVEIPPANFLSKLEPEHQQALLGDIVDPTTGLTSNQHQEGLQELKEWATGGGAAKLAADTQAADAETASTPEYAQVKEQLRQRYTDAGETPEVAETLATKDANAYSNLARSAGMQPSELLNLYNPKVVAGEAPEPGAQAPETPGTQVPEPAPADFPKADTPEGLKPYAVARVPLDQLELDPKRFQYKMNVDASGVTNLLKGRPWNDDLAGVVSTWRDPEDGKTYVVNGHHRYQLAKETGQPDVAVRMIGAKDADEARAKGALQNIAEGRGTAMDAAKFFRDTKQTPAILDRLGISLGEKTATNGLALARLHPALFDQVVNGTVDEGRAVAIGNATADPAEQEAILKLVNRAEDKGKHISNDTVNELARMVKGAGKHTKTQETLFGTQEMTHSLALEKAEISSYIRNKMASEHKTFSSVSDAAKAARLGGVEGQTINVAENSRIASYAAQAKELYDRLSVRTGSVDDILNRASRELAEGGKPNDVKAKAYSDIRDALGSALRGATSERGGVAGEDSGGPAAGKPSPSEPSPSEPGPGERVAADVRDVADAQTLFQSVFHQDQEQPRGWFRVLPDGTYEIGKTKIGDLSTFVHEPAHAYLKILGDLSKRDGASETLKSDYRKVLDFLGAKEGEPLTREQHEAWAQANEKYLREGEAPSPGLKGTFQRFGIWLHSIYKKASDLGVDLTDDIRGVMDRLYASEQGVNKADSEAGPKLFTSPEEAGWSPEQFQSYAEKHNMSADQAKSELLWRQNEAAVRDRTQAWREEEQNVRTAVTADVDQRPEYSAIRSLRKGELDDGTKLTMGKEDLVKQFGEERVKQLQAAHPGLYRNEGAGENPEIVAEVFGYNSADEMMKALVAAPRRSAAIDTATRDYMTAKHGDIRYDGTLEDQARIALENDNRAEGLHSELTALKQKVADMRAKASGQKEAMRAIEVAPIASYREAAKQMVESKAVSDLQPTRYLDASRKYSREAFDAARSGDAEAAAEAKHKELMNHFLFREATDAKEYVGKFEAYAKRVQKTAAQQKLGLAGGDYRDQFNRLLGRYGLGPEVAPGQRALGEWAASEYEQGKEPAIDANILNEARKVNYRNAPVAEIRQLHDALINIRKLASLELEMTVNGKKVEFSAAMANMEAQARESLTAKPSRILQRNATAGERLTDYAQRGNALLMRTEFLMKQLDGGETGPWHDYLWHLASDAQGNEYKLQAEVTKRIGDAFDKMPKEQKLGMYDKVAVDGIPSGPLGIDTRHDLVSIAMNMGNEGNLDRLQKTFLAHGWDPEAIHQVARTLTRAEWQFVQDGWDSLKPLGKAQSDLERRLTGLPPVMVKPTPLDFRLADGTDIHLDGGYYPVMMDPKYSTRGAQADAGTTAQNLMEAGYGRASTSRGNMQARTGFGGPLLLDYEQVLTQHTAKVIKDITHREFMLTANKFLINQDIRQTLRETLGDGYEEKMMPWLRTIINDRNGSATQGLSDVSKILRSLRTNLVKAALTFKVSTVLLQVTHASSMFNYTSPGSYSQALVDFMAHPKDMSDEIRGLSPNEMASRGENIDRDLRALIQTETGKKGIGAAIARAGMAPVQFMDHMMSFPLWLSVYRDGLKEAAELPEATARYQAMQKADGAVRMGLGSNAPKDLPPIMRNNDITKLITTLGGFHNLKYNQMAGAVSEARNGGSIGKLSYGMLMAAVIPAVLGQLVTGRGPKDGENAGLWAAKRALLFPAETIPVIGNILEGAEGKGDVSFSPLQGMGERVAKAAAHVGATNDDKDWTGIGMDGVQSAMDAFGVVGTDQAFKTARYARAANNGSIENPNVWDSIAGSAHK